MNINDDNETLFILFLRKASEIISTSRKSIPFGYLSSGGQLSLTLPSCATKGTIACQAHVRRSKNPFLSHDDEPSGTFVGHPISPLAFEVFPSPPIDFSLHFQVSNALTTQHLLSVISLTNTLMAMSNVSFNQLLPPSSPLSLESAHFVVFIFHRRYHNHNHRHRHHHRRYCHHHLRHWHHHRRHHHHHSHHLSFITIIKFLVIQVQTKNKFYVFVFNTHQLMLLF